MFVTTTSSIYSIAILLFQYQKYSLAWKILQNFKNSFSITRSGSTLNIKKEVDQINQSIDLQIQSINQFKTKILIIRLILVQTIVYYPMHKKYQSAGIVRNKTEIYLLVKQSRRKKLSRFSKQNIMGEKQLSYQLSSVRKPLFTQKPQNSDDVPKTMTSLPPQWIDTYQDCTTLLKQIDQIRKQMMTYQSKRFTVVKQSEQKQIEVRIYECAENATKKIKKCQKLLDKIQKNSQVQSEADHKTCKSMSYKLALELREKTKQIRAQQRAFIQQRKHLQQSTRASFLQMAAEKMLLDDGIDFVQEQELDLDLDSRNEQILKIVQSIYDLNDLYKELNAMVILQGSLLDRIDFNIETARQNVVKGAEHVEKAQQYQQKSSKCAFRTMIFFLIAIAILSVVLAIKWTRHP